MSLINAIGEVLNTKLEKLAQTEISRFVLDELPASFIEVLKHGKLPKLDNDVKVVVLDESADQRYSTGELRDWSFFREDDIAQVRTDFTGTATKILLIVPPGHIPGASLDSTILRIDQVFKPTSEQFLRSISIPENEVRWLTKALVKIAEKESKNPECDRLTLLWEPLIKIDAAPIEDWNLAKVCKSVGLFHGTDSINWDRSIALGFKVSSIVSKRGLSLLLLEWIEQVENSTLYSKDPHGDKLEHWKKHIVESVAYDIYRFLIMPISSYSQLVTNDPEDSSHWYYVLDYNFWKWLIEGAEDPSSKAGTSISIKSINHVHHSKIGGTTVYVYSSNELRNEITPNHLEEEVWKYRQTEIEIVESNEGNRVLKLNARAGGVNSLSVSGKLDGEEKNGKIKVATLDNDQLPLFIDPRDGELTSVNASNSSCSLTLNGTGYHQLWVYRLKEWGIVDNQVQGFGVLSDVIDDEEAVIFEVKASIELNSNVVIDVIEIVTDESSSLKFKMVKDQNEVTINVDITAFSGKASFKVQDYYNKLINENLLGPGNSKKPELDQSLSEFEKLEKVLLEKSNGYPIIFSQDLLEIDESNFDFQKSIYSRYSLPESFDNRIAPKLFNDELQEVINARKNVANLLLEKLSATKSIEKTDLVHDKNFVEAVHEYISIFEKGISSSKTDAWRWFETLHFHDLVDRKDSIDQNIICTFLTPLHPICLGWQVGAQNMLWETLRSQMKCPQAAILSSYNSPSYWELSETKMVSIKTSMDYWRCYSEDPKALVDDQKYRSFFKTLGVALNSSNLGLKSNQVESALDQVSKIYPVNSSFSISVSGEGGNTEVNQGLTNWMLDNCSNQREEDKLTQWTGRLSPSLSIWDSREPDQNFSADTLGYLKNDVNVDIKYYKGQVNHDKNEIFDLSLLTNLTIPHQRIMEGKSIKSIASLGGLIKFDISSREKEGAVRTTLTTRYGKLPDEEVTLDKLQDLLRTIEEKNAGKNCFDYVYNPDSKLFNYYLEKSEFQAVSSPLIDVSYLSGSSKGESDVLIWQYDLPQYGGTRGSNDGYYLVSRLQSDFNFLFESKLKQFGVELNSNINVPQLTAFANKRGVVDLKKFVAGGASSVGEIGMLVSQLIIAPDNYYSAFRGILNSGNADDIELCIPIDPFELRLNGLRRAIGAANYRRPDFLIVRITNSEIFISVLEIKCRSNQFVDNDLKEVFKEQVAGFMKFLIKLKQTEKKHGLWKASFNMLLTEIILFGYGLRRSSHEFNDDTTAILMERLSRLHSGDLNVCLDARHGRIISISECESNEFIDLDGDGFGEVLRINKDYLTKVFDPSQIDQFLTSINNQPQDWFEHICLDESLFEGEEINEEEFASDELENNSESTEEEIISEQIEQIEEIDTEKEIEIPSAEFTEDKAPIEQPVNEEIIKEAETPDPESVPSDNLGVRFKVGETKGTLGDREFIYHPSNTDLTQLNMGIVGDLGTGKTQLLKTILFETGRQASNNRGSAPKFLILDTKRDYDGSSSQLDEKLISTLGAKTIKPFRMPLNVFDISKSTHFDPKVQKAYFFVDILDKIYSGIGPVQRNNLLAAIDAAFEERGYVPNSDYSNFQSPTINDVFEHYKELVKKPDTPYSIMGDLVRMQMFENDAANTVSFSEYFNSSLVVSLGDIANLKNPLKVALVIFLNLYQEYMLGVEKKPFLGESPKLRYVDSYILIDEAKLIMDQEFQVLEDLLRKGREFGVGVILSSQYLGDFKAGKVNYGEALSTWFIHRVPNITEKELSQIGIKNAKGLDEKIKSLPPHWCLYKTFNVPGEIIEGIPLFRIIP